MNTTCNQTGGTRSTNGCSVNSAVGTVQNRVYLDKIFYDNAELSCPIIASLTANETNFTQELVIGGQAGRTSCGCTNNGCTGGIGCSCSGNGSCGGTSCGSSGNCGCGCSGGCASCNSCGCCNFDFNCNTRFTITNSCVTVNEIFLSETATLPTSAVTVDGFPVSALMLRNGRYVADLSGIMPDITRCPCTPRDRHLCDRCGSCSPCAPSCDNDGHFFLAEAPGPWQVSLTIVLEGTVSNGKQTCNFKLTLKTRNDSTGFFPLIVNGSSNFAMYCVEIPCQTNGIAPSLLFDFNACGILMNPTLTIAETSSQRCADAISLALTSNLVLTPGMHLQVARPTLFALQADELKTCCDDLGQCAGEENCSACSQTCTCPSGQQHTGNSCQNRPQNACGSTQGSTRTCGCGTGTAGIRSITCQCCDTNGYLF